MRDERSVRGAWRKATVAALVAVASGGLLAACSAGVTVASAPSAVIATTADCRAPQVLEALGLATTSSADAAATVPVHPDAPDAGAVPDGFHPTAVVACAAGGPLRDAQGTWTSVTETRREGDLSALLTALRGASRTSPTAGGTRCEAVAGLQLWLVDVQGQAIRVEAPTTPCGAPTAAVQAAVDALTATDVVTYPVSLVPRG